MMNEWMYHTLSYFNDDKVINSKLDVNFEGLYPEMDIIPPAKRTY